jgi:hypothetical protein
MELFQNISINEIRAFWFVRKLGFKGFEGRPTGITGTSFYVFFNHTFAPLYRDDDVLRPSIILLHHACPTPSRIFDVRSKK